VPQAVLWRVCFRRKTWSHSVTGNAKYGAAVNIVPILIDKILDADRVLGGLDRVYGQVDWGGLPRPLVEASITRLATEIAPAVRTTLAS
jgi:hypothetical protein